MEDAFFWILTGAVGIVVLGGGIAMALVRDGALEEDAKERPDLAPRRSYGGEARDGAR